MFHLTWWQGERKTRTRLSCWHAVNLTLTLRPTESALNPTETCDPVAAGNGNMACIGVILKAIEDAITSDMVELHNKVANALDRLERAEGVGEPITIKTREKEWDDLCVERDRYRASIDYKNAVSRRGYNAMHKAVINGHTQVVRHLCELKVDCDQRDYYGHSPLMEAALHGHIDTLMKLLEKKADPTLTNVRGETALQMCRAKDPNSATTTFLAAVQAGEESQSAFESTWRWATLSHDLKQAAVTGDLPKMKEIFASFDDEDLANTIKEMQEELETLKSGEGRREDIYELESKLCILTEEQEVGDAATAEMKAELTEMNGDWIDPIDLETTALICAATTAHMGCMKCLIANKADITGRDVKGRTPLHMSCSNGHVEAVKLLHSHKAGVNHLDTSGYTCLHAAAKNNATEVVDLLIEWKADLNRADKVGNTALAVADRECHAEVIKTLMAQKASLQASKSVSAFATLVSTTGIGTTEAKRKAVKTGKTPKKFADPVSQAFAAPEKKPWEEDDIDDSFWGNPLGGGDVSADARFLGGGI